MRLAEAERRALACSFLPSRTQHGHRGSLGSRGCWVCVMRLLSSALFFSLGLAIGTVISDAGAGQGPSLDVPASLQITASDASKASAAPDASPLLTPSAVPEVHRELPTARCDRDMVNCASAAAQTARS